MQVHFIAVEVSVVRTAHALIEAERPAAQCSHEQSDHSYVARTASTPACAGQAADLSCHDIATVCLPVGLDDNRDAF